MGAVQELRWPLPINKAYEELDHGMTPIGELVLRRRKVLSLGGADVYEVKLNGQFLMSSLVNDAEIALAEWVLPTLEFDACDVVVGGLGLGYTAAAALDGDNVRSVTVVEYIDRVIDWHRLGMVPLANLLTSDPRCRIIHADFFDAVSCENKTLELPQYHAILVDIDHSPQALLQPAHAEFYSRTGLTNLAKRIHPGGIFALWSADPPDTEFLDALRGVFATVEFRECHFQNPLLDEDDTNYIVVARLA